MFFVPYVLKLGHIKLRHINIHTNIIICTVHIYIYIMFFYIYLSTCIHLQISRKFLEHPCPKGVLEPFCLRNLHGIARLHSRCRDAEICFVSFFRFFWVCLLVNCVPSVPLFQETGECIPKRRSYPESAMARLKKSANLEGMAEWENGGFNG